MTESQVVQKSNLSAEDTAQLRHLKAVCHKTDGVIVKWDLMPDRDASRVLDLCWYEEGQIVGSVQMDGSGEECEVTGVVLPAYRGRGIFRRLFQAAQAEAQRRGARQLLLVSYPHFPDGTVVARRLGTTYRFSEYHMEAEAAAIPPLPPSTLRLEEATPDDVAELSDTIGLSLGGGRWLEPDALREALQQSGQRFFLARLGREAVGQIGTVAAPGDEVYLRAVGILHARRRQGLGRQMLAATVHHLMSEGHTRFSLDVETDNAQALSLYRDCGFRGTVVYDYSHVPLT